MVMRRLGWGTLSYRRQIGIWEGITYTSSRNI